MKSDTIEFVSREKCTGCKLCGDVCPSQAIEYRLDKDGFWYPEIDHSKCISCGLCYKKCPINNSGFSQNRAVLKCYGAKTKSEDIRVNSTSGGFFSELAYKWIENGGYVIGAAYDMQHQVFHTIVSDEEGIKKLRQSKYVQSDTSGIYKKARNLVIKGEKVLFCGTPCQVEAFLYYLGKQYDNVLTLDFICCGVCSPGLYKLYLAELEKKYKSKVAKVWFKNKHEGWRNIGTRVDFENGRHYFRVGSRDLFMTAFVIDGLSMRLSCDQCCYRKLPHASDIMIGDFWGIETVNPTFDDNKGVSAVLINSKAGLQAFESIKENLDYFETTKEDISKGNFTIYKSKQVHPRRQEFFNLVNAQGFRKTMTQFSSYSGLKKIQIDFLYFRSRLKHLIKK